MTKQFWVGGKQIEVFINQEGEVILPPIVLKDDIDCEHLLKVIVDDLIPYFENGSFEDE